MIPLKRETKSLRRAGIEITKSPPGSSSPLSLRASLSGPISSRSTSSSSLLIIKDGTSLSAPASSTIIEHLEKSGLMEQESCSNSVDGEDSFPSSLSSSPTTSPLVLNKSLSTSLTSIDSAIAESERQAFIRQCKLTTETFLKVLLKKKPNVKDQRGDVMNFLEDTNDSIAAFISKNGGLYEDEDLINTINLREEIQIFLFFKLFRSMLDGCENEAEDEALSQRIASFNWILPQHLEIPREQRNYALWDAAATELSLINSFVTPRQKLTCIMNCAKIIIYLLEGAGSIANADDFLPHMIYIVLRSNLPNLQTNIHFLSWFTEQTDMNGEVFYFFTHLMSAVSFVSIISASTLNISEDDFNRFMGIEKVDPLQSNASSKALKILGYKSKAVLHKSPSKKDVKGSKEGNSPLSPPATPPEEQRAVFSRESSPVKRRSIISNEGDTSRPSSSISVTEASSIDTESLANESTLAKLRQLQQRYPFLDCTIHDIRVGDIEGLLEGYKELAVLLAQQGEAVDKPPTMQSLRDVSTYKLILKAREYRDPLVHKDQPTTSSVNTSEKEQHLFRLVSIKKLRIRSLHKALQKRFNKSSDTIIEKVILLPDTCIERNEDLIGIENYARVEIIFSDNNQTRGNE